MDEYKIVKREKGYALGKNLLMFVLIINCILFLNYNLLSFYRKVWIINIPILILIIILKKNIDIKGAKNLYFMLLYTICSIVSILINKGGIGSVINNIYIVLIYIVLTQFKLCKKDLKKILCSYSILCISWIVRTPGYYNKIINLGVININPNIVACIILFTTMMICVLTTDLNLKYSKIINIVFLILASISFISLESRGGLLSILLFIIFKYIIIDFKYYKKKLVVISAIIILIGIIFPSIYLALYQKGINLKIPFIEKNFYTGREIIWNNFYIEFNHWKEYIMGLGSNIKILNNENVDLHNNYLAIICNFGFLGMVNYSWFILKNIYDRCNKREISIFKFDMLICFFCVLINGYFEATVYFSPIFIFMFIFLGIEKEEEKEKLSEKNKDLA